MTGKILPEYDPVNTEQKANMNYSVNEIGLPEPIVSPELQDEIDRLIKNGQDLKPSQRDSETLAEEREKNTQARSQFRWPGQTDYQRVRFGKIMHQSEFILRLRSILPTAYLHDFALMGRRGFSYIKPGEGPTFISTIHNGYSPEFSTMRFDEFGVPTKEKYRGWRTALLAAITRGVVTEEQVEKAFGPCIGPESGPYLRQLWEYRNKRQWQ